MSEPSTPADPATAPLDDGSGLMQRLLARWPEQEREYALLGMDCEGRVVGLSAGTPLVLASGPERLIGQPVDVIFTPDDRQHGLPALERQIALSVGYSEDDRWHLRGDGTRAWFGGMLFAVRDEDGHCMGFVKVMRDRTDLRAQIETLENRVAALRAALRDKDEHLTKLAHELANPLGPLLQACHLLGQAGDAQRPRLLEVVGRQLETLRRLVGDVRAAIGSQVRPPELVLQRLCLQDLLRQCGQALEEGARQHGLSMELLLPEVPVWMDADPARLHQVVLNLLSNAIKYTPSGGRVWLKATVEDNAAVVRVGDTGVGIAPDMLPRIFELFTQEPASQHLSEGGLGVGLAVVKQWVALHGGTVEVRSEGRGRGADFTVRLPLRQPGGPR